MGHLRSGVTMGTVETDAVFRDKGVGIRIPGRAEGKGRIQGWNFRSGVPVVSPAGTPAFFDLAGRRLKAE